LAKPVVAVIPLAELFGQGADLSPSIVGAIFGPQAER